MGQSSSGTSNGRAHESEALQEEEIEALHERAEGKVTAN